MKLKELKINNYRSLDDLTVAFHPDINFIVGENNLGKSNLLRLLNTLTNANNFNEEDFKDKEQSITLSLSLTLVDNEIGIFEDLIDPLDKNVIHIEAIQENIDDNISFNHKETGTPIKPYLIKCLNFINYSSLRIPSNDLNFKKGGGSGRFLGNLVKGYMESGKKNEVDFIDSNKFEELLDYANNRITKIKTFNDFSIKANLDNNIENLLSKIIVLKNKDNFELTDLGYGVQFLNLIPLTIIDKLYKILTNKNRLENSTFIDQEDNRVVPLIIGLDEPEIHLHPHMQRSLMKYLLKIFQDEDQEFKELIKDLFEVDGVEGQLIIITHSPDILVDNYKNIIRLYQDKDGKIDVKNGVEIELETDVHKHLQMNLKYVKEAFYSRGIIIVEGYSEYGAFPVFAERMGIDLDQEGISIITAGSANSVPPLMTLFQEFGVGTVGIIDNDKAHEPRFQGISNLYSTERSDFEEEIYPYLKITDFIKYREEQDPDKKDFFIAEAKKVGIEIDYSQSVYYQQLSEITDEQENALKEALKPKISRILKKNKSIVMGQVLANCLTEIPNKYAEVLNSILKLNKNMELEKNE